MELLFHIYFIKLLGWIDNIIKYFSHLLFFIFFIKFLIGLKTNKIFLTKVFKYYLYFYIFIFIFLIQNFVILQNPNEIFSKELFMYFYNFTISIFFFAYYKFTNYIRLMYIFLFYLIIVFIVDIIFLYDFYIANYSIGFIHHIEKNVATVYYTRGCGFFSDPTASATIVLAFPIIFFSIKKYFYIKYEKIIFLFSIISILITTSKLGVILFFIELFLINFFFSKKNFFINIIKYVFLMVLLSLFVLVLILYLYNIGIPSIVNMVDFFLNPTHQETLTDRIYTYNMAMKMINNNLLIGVGMGKPQLLIGLSIHNTILQAFAENGMIGILFIIFFYIFFPYIIYKTIDILFLKYMFFIWYIIFFIKSMFADIMHTHVPIVYFLVIGFLYNLNSFLKEVKNEKNFIYKRG
jgi:O-antigen ligase